MARTRLDTLVAILQTLHFNTGASCAASNGLHRFLKIGCCQVRCLGPCDHLTTSASRLALVVVVGAPPAAVDAVGFLRQNARGRRVTDEGEAAVAVYWKDTRNRQTALEGLALGVERLAKLHDVHT